MKFEEFPFMPALQKGIAEIGFVDCTPVQEQSFQAYFAGKDIYAQSQTGTGKTAAFMLAGMQELARRNQCTEELPETLPSDIKMLILSPTRELAEQIEQEASLLAQFFPVDVAAFYGGVGYEKQRAHLGDGVQIITGTPGRIIDLAKSNELPLHQVFIAVLDEADRMLDMGFIDDVRWIMGKLPPKEERLTMLFSATLNARVGNLTWEFMRSNEIAEIIIEPEQITTENVEQEIYHVGDQEKLRLLLSLLKKHKPESCLIFCNTKNGASFLEGRLNANDYEAKALMGDLPQVKRNQIIGQLKAGKLRIVVATDVASRGLHIEGLPLVINYDLPDEAENYVHRIGRTARAGAKGHAISLACQRYVRNLMDIERYLDDKIPVAWFPEEELVKDSGSFNRRHREEGRRKDPQDFKRKDAQDSKRKDMPDFKNKRPKSNRAESPRRERRPNGRPQSKEDRLRYYQEKYGEDFGVEKTDSRPDTDSRPNNNGKSNKNGRKPQRNSQNRTQNKPNSQRKSQSKPQDKPQDKSQSKPQDKPQGKQSNRKRVPNKPSAEPSPRPSQSAAAPKRSFLQKLFGKK